MAARARWAAFLDGGLDRYHEDRNHPDRDGASNLSPYLHFGHISVHRIFHDIVEREDWATGEVDPGRAGRREGWWGMSVPAEAFLDEVVTWREVGYHFCHHRPDHRELSSLPSWAQATMAAHADDRRPVTYTLAQLDAAQTGDEIWNAALNQLRREGRIHNYLRMLWGKKIYEWSPSAQVALDVMVELNNRYALDGRDPNSYSGIFWVLGRFDRAWGPERPIFGKLRYMTSASTRRKLKLSAYLEAHASR